MGNAHLCIGEGHSSGHIFDSGRPTLPAVEPTVRAHPATLLTVKRGGVSRRGSRRRGELKLHSIQRLAQLSAHLTTQDYVLFMDSDMILRQPIDPVAMGRAARRVFLFHSGAVFLF